MRIKMAIDVKYTIVRTVEVNSIDEFRAKFAEFHENAPRFLGNVNHALFWDHSERVRRGSFFDNEWRFEQHESVTPYLTPTFVSEYGYGKGKFGEYVISPDEYIDYVNAHKEHPLHVTDPDVDDETDDWSLKDELIANIRMAFEDVDDEQIGYDADINEIKEKLINWIIRATNSHPSMSLDGLWDAVKLYYQIRHDIDEDVAKALDYDLAMDAIVGCNHWYSEADVVEMALTGDTDE